MPERPLCACGNLGERVGSGLGFRQRCSSCRKRKRGRPVGGYQKRRDQLLAGVVREICADCLCTHSDPGFFDVHHANGDPGDDSKENLLVLCPNCHRRRHLPQE